jgi:transaldolase
MIKVPATAEGIPAIRHLIGAGINVNVTLMFSMAHYESVAQAYIEGIERLVESGGDPGRVSSVASFFVSRVDSAVDKQLIALNQPAAQELLGKTAVANSKVVYQRFKSLFFDERFSILVSAGANVQRLLWASTSAKNPNYPDTLYVDQLIGPDTVNTMPPKTIEAFRDHGRVGHTLEQDAAGAQLVLDNLAELGIDLDQVTDKLQQDGVAAFSHSFDSLLATLEQKIEKLAKSS